MCSPKLIKAGYGAKTFILCLAFGVLTLSVSSPSGHILNITDYICNMASQEDLVVINDDDDWPDVGPQNPEEAQVYEVYPEAQVKEDRNDVLPITISTLKQIISRYWPSMANADMDIILHSIKDLACLHLQQEVMPVGSEVVDPEEEMPSSHKFLHQLPEKKCKAEEKSLIIATLDNISKAQPHMSTATVNL